METLERYKNEGLENPILVVTNLKMHAVLWGGGAFLLLGCVVALFEEGLYAPLIGLIGLVFFGLCFGIYAIAIYRGRTKGLVGLYKDGLWLSTFDAILPWQCIVSAWVTKMGTTNVVMLLVNGIDDHIPNPDIITRFFLWVMKRATDLNKHPLTQTTLEAFCVLNLTSTPKGIGEAFEQARKEAASDPSATMLSIPHPFLIGIEPEELAAIITHQAVAHRINLPLLLSGNK